MKTSEQIKKVMDSLGYKTADPKEFDDRPTEENVVADKPKWTHVAAIKPLRKEEKAFIYKTVKGKGFKLKEARKVSESKVFIFVEKYDQSWKVEYSTKADVLPFKVQGRRFDTLKESIENIFIPLDNPFNKKYNDTIALMHKQFQIQEDMRREKAWQTTGLSDSEKMRRNARGIEILGKMMDEASIKKGLHFRD